MAAIAIQSPFGHPPLSCIEIPYRDEGNGGGAFYDHYTVQKITNRETRLSVPAGMTIDSLESYVRSGTTHTLLHGTRTSDGKLIPPMIKQTDCVGLLIITGHARESETKRAAVLALRDVHERKLLQKARNQGRPILTICAGTWQLWSFFGGTLQDVQDHAWEKMPSITVKGKIGCNTQMHKVVITASSMLAGAVTDGGAYVRQQHALCESSSDHAASHPLELIVNSVHWKAPDPITPLSVAKSQSVLAIVATAQQDDSIVPQRNKTGTGAFKHPDAGTVEAIEQEHGAPLLGIQWHPEAYNNDGLLNSRQQRSILTYMAKAGDAFCAKRKMIASFDADFQDVLVRFGGLALGHTQTRKTWV